MMVNVPKLRGKSNTATCEKGRLPSRNPNLATKNPGSVDVYHCGVYDCGYLGCHEKNILHATHQ